MRRLLLAAVLLPLLAPRAEAMPKGIVGDSIDALADAATEAAIATERVILVGGVIVYRYRHTIAGAALGCATLATIGGTSSAIAGVATGGGGVAAAPVVALAGCGVGAIVGGRAGWGLDRPAD